MLFSLTFLELLFCCGVCVRLFCFLFFDFVVIVCFVFGIWAGFVFVLDFIFLFVWMFIYIYIDIRFLKQTFFCFSPKHANKSAPKFKNKQFFQNLNFPGGHRLRAMAESSTLRPERDPPARIPGKRRWRPPATMMPVRRPAAHAERGDSPTLDIV